MTARLAGVASCVAVLSFACVCSTAEPTVPSRPAHEGEGTTLELGVGIRMEFAYIPAGEFVMGSPQSNSEPGQDERPAHRVRISRSFLMGRYEVTQGQWRVVMGGNPSQFAGDARLPVERVSWDDCRAFCRKASLLTGRQIRLPTEAEWEYACRAGTTGPFGPAASDKQLGEFASLGGKTSPVGARKPNRWGLYDMQGNVWEWCQDWYGPYLAGEQTDPAGPANGEVRVLRGGCWNSDAYNCRCSNRLWSKSSTRRYNSVGFRVVMVP